MDFTESENESTTPELATAAEIADSAEALLIGDPGNGYMPIDTELQLDSRRYTNQGKGFSMPPSARSQRRHRPFLGSPPGTPTHAHIPTKGALSPNASTSRWDTAPISPNENTTQLTILYGGTVNVYDHVPAYKVKTIMLLARSGNPHTNGNDADFCHSSGPTSRTEEVLSAMDLPLKRKRSFRRFLKKRQERLHARAPYD